MADSAWWCTPCGAWRRVKSLRSVGPICRTCGSGRVRPPLPGEDTDAALAALPKLTPEEIRRELDGDPND